MVDFRNVDLKAVSRKAMEQYGFEAVFPANLMAEVDVLEDQAKKAEPGVRDMGNLLWSSIDNSDSEDLDQIEYCESGHGGEILVKVAIADVDMYVPNGSHADAHAHRNTTSVYTGIETYPMLPDRLSKNLSSLLAGEARVAVVVEFAVLPSGDVRPGEIYKALVENRGKLAYDDVGDWLEGKGPLPKSVSDVSGLEAQLRLQDEASARLGSYREERGALELDTLEVKTVMQGGQVSDLVVVEKNKARRLIENFMIAANGVMSGFLENAGIPTIQRVVRIPNDWKGIADVARAHGASLPAAPDAKALSKFLAEQKKANPEGFPDLSLTVVKLLGSGEYVMFDRFQPRVGHFCLAVTDYTHATAPNRRYVDIIIQRLLKAVLGKAPSPYRNGELSQLASWCTEREKASKKVERLMRKTAAAFLLAGKIGQSFNAIVTGASNKGTYVRLIAPPAEGRVMRGAEDLRVGQKVVARLVNLDPNRGFIDFEVLRPKQS
jgi:exoribonuclease-2